MKQIFTHLLLFMFIINVSPLKAQYRSYLGWRNYQLFYDILNENKLKETTKSNSIKRVHKDYKHKGRIKSTSEREYDREGRVILDQPNKDLVMKMEYYPNDLLKQVWIIQGKKLIERDSFCWNARGLQEACLYFDEDDKLFMEERTSYRDSLITEYVYKKRKHGKFKEMQKQVYDYAADGSPQRITYYKKGKQDYYTVFDCSPLGENHKVKRDSSYYCVKQDVDSLGNKIKVTIVNEKTIPRKEIIYYNDQDAVIAIKTFELKSNEPMWFTFYKTGIKEWSEFISYKNNKEYYHQVKTFNDNKQETGSTRFMRGKLRSKYFTIYNDKGLAKRTESYNKRLKLKEVKEISYEYF